MIDIVPFTLLNRETENLRDDVVLSSQTNKKI